MSLGAGAWTGSCTTGSAEPIFYNQHGNWNRQDTLNWWNELSPEEQQEILASPEILPSSPPEAIQGLELDNETRLALQRFEAYTGEDTGADLPPLSEHHSSIRRDPAFIDKVHKATQPQTPPRSAPTRESPSSLHPFTSVPLPLPFSQDHPSSSAKTLPSEKAW